MKNRLSFELICVGHALVVWTSCGSSDPGTTSAEETTTSGTETTSSSTSGTETATGSDSAAPQCEGEPWQAQDATSTPPTAYAACESDGDCAVAQMDRCCGTFVVAVAGRFQHCIAERNAGATCRATCVITPGGPPTRTARCQEHACVVVDADGTARRVIEAPMYADTSR